jgi:hypothetical protein
LLIFEGIISLNKNLSVLMFEGFIDKKFDKTNSSHHRHATVDSPAAPTPTCVDRLALGRAGVGHGRC